uniref:Putative ribonuclease H-like domain-containing protein n=1 Tax=Tanacetum cinerariifolium TaxID=118510 RepID=A0A6L2P3R6_TANCI|nr:putative ribonuclease H-like domain-containing protein [Tanacetum cinerariifolium]
MLKAFPLPVMSSHCHSLFQLLEKTEFRDSNEAPQQESTIASTSERSAKKKGRIVVFTTEEMQKRRNDVKARTTLLLALPDEHQLRFSKYKTSKELWAAILKTFGGNEATKKTKKNLLKQQYGNFKGEGSEILEKTFNKLQAIISHLEFMDIEIEQDDLNQKFLTSLAPEWLMHTIKKIGTKISIQWTDVAGFNKSKVECHNCHKMGHFAKECRAPRSQDKGRRDNYKQGSKVEEQAPKALMAIDEVGWDWSFMANEEENHALVADEEAPTEFALMAKSSSDNKVFDNSLCSKAYNAKKEKDDLDSKLTGFQSASKDLDNLLKSQRSDKNKEGLGYSVVPPPAQVYSPLKKDMSWIGLLEFVDDTITNYSMPSPAIESKSDDLQTKNPFVTETRASSSTILSKPAINFMKSIDRPTETKTDKVETAKKPVVKYAKLYRKTSKSPNGNSQHNIDDKGYWDSGCSRYMTGNISYLSDYEPFKGGYVSFGQGGCKITSKRTIKTGKLKFENVYFVKYLKYNLFSVSQICDNKNSVLFTDTECIVLGQNFRLKDDTNVLLRTPRQHNMYSIDLNNVVPHKDLTCLVAKASLDESMLWHWRLGHLNFKTMNMLVSHNLFKGLPSKCFENDHTCTACLKRKQHKASCTNDAASQEVKKDVSSLRYIALPNWFHETLLKSSSSNAQGACNADAPESSRNPNLTTTTTNPSADQMKTLRVETPIPTVSSLVPTDILNDSLKPSGDTRLIFKRVICQDETPSLDNITTLANRFDDILRVTISIVDSHREEADVEAIQEELLQFKIQNVWVLVNCPREVRPIGTKWVLKNKKDARGIVIRNKTMLVAQGHRQEEGIDYEEVFTPVARIEAIRLLLAYASFMGFTVYQMDVKSAFLYGTIDGEIYDKYVGEILKKIGYSDVMSANTPMDKENPWGKDGPGKDVEHHLCSSMIISLMYLTASRPDIMFAVCACARHQLTPKECHLHAVKKIFRYLKGHPKLGIWYPKESPFDLVAYSDSDYGGAAQDRKSTTEGCQFLGKRLISWQCKKQIIFATSTTEAEYVVAASSCGQVLWIQNQLLDYGYNFMNIKIYIDNNSAICIVKNPVYHSKPNHIEIRHHFIRDCFEKKLISVDHIHTDDNVVDLLIKPFDVGRFQYLVVSIRMVNP